MSEGQTIRDLEVEAALVELGSDPNAEVTIVEANLVRERFAALEARLAEAELALRAIASLRLNTRLSTERAVAQARIRMQEIARAALSSESERSDKP